MLPESAEVRAFTLPIRIQRSVGPAEQFYQGKFDQPNEVFGLCVTTNNISESVRDEYELPVKLTRMMYLDFRTDEHFSWSPRQRIIPDTPDWMIEKGREHYDQETIARVMLGLHPNDGYKKIFNHHVASHPGDTILVIGAHGTYKSERNTKDLDLFIGGSGVVKLHDLLDQIPGLLDRFGCSFDRVSLVHLRACNPLELVRKSKKEYDRKTGHKRSSRLMVHKEKVFSTEYYISKGSRYTHISFPSQFVRFIDQSNMNLSNESNVIYARCRTQIRLIENPYDQAGLVYATSSIQGNNVDGRALSLPNGKTVLSL